MMRPKYDKRMQWSKKNGCFMSFWCSQESPAKLKAIINKNYCVTLKDGRSCTGIFEGYLYKMAFEGAPVHVYLMFEIEKEHAVLLESEIVGLK